MWDRTSHTARYGGGNAGHTSASTTPTIAAYFQRRLASFDDIHLNVVHSSSASTSYPGIAEVLDRRRSFLLDNACQSSYLAGMHNSRDNIELGILVILIMILVALTGGCNTEREPEPRTSTCAQYVTEACDADDAECAAAIMDDCAPPTCDAPPGQHC